MATYHRLTDLSITFLHEIFTVGPVYSDMTLKKPRETITWFPTQTSAYQISKDKSAGGLDMLTDTGEESKLVHRRKRPEEDAL